MKWNDTRAQPPHMFGWSITWNQPLRNEYAVPSVEQRGAFPAEFLWWALIPSLKPGLSLLLIPTGAGRTGGVTYQLPATPPLRRFSSCGLDRSCHASIYHPQRRSLWPSDNPDRMSHHQNTVYVGTHNETARDSGDVKNSTGPFLRRVLHIKCWALLTREAYFSYIIRQMLHDYIISIAMNCIWFNIKHRFR